MLGWLRLAGLEPGCGACYTHEVSLSRIVCDIQLLMVKQGAPYGYNIRHGEVPTDAQCVLCRDRGNASAHSNVSRR